MSVTAEPTASTAPIVSVRDATCTLGGRTVLDKVSLEVPPGEFKTAETLMCWTSLATPSPFVTSATGKLVPASCGSSPSVVNCTW